MTDLSTLQAGDRVKFRCGGESKVYNVSPSIKMDFKGLWIQLIEKRFGANYRMDGTVFPADGIYCGETPFDIIEIIKKPFDWGQIKEGREYIIFGNYAEYIGLSDTLKLRVFYLKGDCSFAAFKETQNIKISDRVKP